MYVPCLYILHNIFNNNYSDNSDDFITINSDNL